MARLRDNQERARMAQIWIKISMGVYVIMVPYIFYVLSFSGSFIRPSQDELMFLGLLSVVVIILVVGAFIGSAVTFIQWFRRAYYNLHQLTGGLTYTEGWAAGAWFVPIFNLFGPYQIAKETITKSEKLLSDDSFERKPSNLLQTAGIWWGFWIASGVVDRIDIVVDNNPMTDLKFSLVSIVLGLIAGVFALKYIKNYSEMELKLRDLEDGNNAPIVDSSDLLDSAI